MAEMKNICGKIPVELHEKVRAEIEEKETSTQIFIQQVIEEHFNRLEGKGEENIRRQIRRKESDRLRILKEQEEVEDYINGIDDPEIKEIFELHYLEGKKQSEVAEIVNIDRSYVSKKISDYLKLSHFSQK